MRRRRRRRRIVCGVLCRPARRIACTTRHKPTSASEVVGRWRNSQFDSSHEGWRCPQLCMQIVCAAPIVCMWRHPLVSARAVRHAPASAPPPLRERHPRHQLHDEELLACGSWSPGLSSRVRGSSWTALRACTVASTPAAGSGCPACGFGRETMDAPTAHSETVWLGSCTSCTNSRPTHVSPFKNVAVLPTAVGRVTQTKAGRGTRSWPIGTPSRHAPFTQTSLAAQNTSAEALAGSARGSRQRVLPRLPVA